MYTLAVKRDFIAQHYLIGGDWGVENQLHSHHYMLELQLEGATLDQHGYLVDIVEIEKILDVIVATYWYKTLNEMPGFSDLNPSLEHFCSNLCQFIASQIQQDNIKTITVKLWESEAAWASYRIER